MIKDLLEGPEMRLTIFLLMALGLICPGILLVAVFAPEYFPDVDNFRLILISVSLTFPLFALNMLFSMCMFPQFDRKPLSELELFCGVLVGSSITNCILY